MDLIEQLRAATRTIHARIEALPLAQALAASEVGKAEYGSLLGRLWWAHRAFEDEATVWPTVAAVWPREAVRSHALARDLAALGADAGPTPPPSVTAWRDQLWSQARVSPAVWGGAGYVFEGSRMGGRVLLGPIARGLGLVPAPGVGLDYHREGMDDPGGRWRRVREALAILDATPADRDALVFGAVATFDLMTCLHSAPVSAVPHRLSLDDESVALTPVGGFV